MIPLKAATFSATKQERFLKGKSVTIAAGVLCPDGIVLCADTQETTGTSKREVRKLVELPLVSPSIKAVVVGSTEDVIFLDRLVERLSEEIDRTDGYLGRVRTAVEDTVLDYCGKVWPLYASQPDRPVAHLLLGLRTIDGLSLLEMCTPTVRSIPAHEFIGSGREIAAYKAKHFFNTVMPVEVAAGILAFILDVVKDNDIFCGGPTQMAIIRSDGSVEHKNEEQTKRIGATLTKWDYYSNRLGAIIPFLQIAGKPATEYFATTTNDEPNFLDDKKLEHILFGLLAGPQSVGTIPIEDLARQVAVVMRGALNVKDASVFDEITETKKIIEHYKRLISSDAGDPALKRPLNALIEAQNKTVDAVHKWRALVEQHKDANIELDCLEAALADLRTARDTCNTARVMQPGALEVGELESPRITWLAGMALGLAKSLEALQSAEIAIHVAGIVTDSQHQKLQTTIRAAAQLGKQATDAIKVGEVEGAKACLSSIIRLLNEPNAPPFPT